MKRLKNEDLAGIKRRTREEEERKCAKELARRTLEKIGAATYSGVHCKERDRTTAAPANTMLLSFTQK